MVGSVLVECVLVTLMADGRVCVNRVCVSNAHG